MHAVSISEECAVQLAKGHLLTEIEATARAAADRLGNDMNYDWCRVFPRHRARFRWRGRDMRLWRLDLVHPLWLGADGEIYRGYEIDMWDGREYPRYLMLAEIELRGIKGLERVLNAVQAIGQETSSDDNPH